MATKPIENQQFFVVLGTCGHDLTYVTVFCKEINIHVIVSVGLGTTKNIHAKSTQIQLVSKITSFIMPSLIPSSKSVIINMISQNNYNQIIEISPSCSAYHSEFVTKFLSEKC